MERLRFQPRADGGDPDQRVLSDDDLKRAEQERIDEHVTTERASLTHVLICNYRFDFVEEVFDPSGELTAVRGYLGRWSEPATSPG
jgi:hypothetical protein